MNARKTLSRLRPRVKRTAERAGMGGVAERLAPVVGGRVARRDRRDNQAMGVALAVALASNSNCVDVGANEGRVLEQLVRLAPQGQHVAYEPLPALHADLATRFPGVDVRRKALSDRAGRSAFTHVVSRPGYSGFREQGYPGNEQVERLEVETETLDSALPQGQALALVKIDVEGAEGEVLRGAVRSIERWRPVVLLEHGAAARSYGTAPRDIHELLSACGLRLFDMDGNGPYSLQGFEEVCGRGTYWNFAAVPQERA